MRYRAILAYDGTPYRGFQRLTSRAEGEDSTTVQGILEAAIGKISGGDQPVNVIGAGRTDTGVHATGQVIAFDLEWKHRDADLIRAINATLPTEIALQTLERAAEGFHPRFDAKSRSYGYLVFEAPERQPLVARNMWWVRSLHQLDVAHMNQAAVKLLGDHDFASFGAAPQGENTRREVLKSEWTVEPISERVRLVEYKIEATAFLYHMVRTIVAMMVEVGLKRISTAEFVDIFQSKDRGRAYRIAPPHGLTLTEVKY